MASGEDKPGRFAGKGIIIWMALAAIIAAVMMTVATFKMRV